MLTGCYPPRIGFDSFEGKLVLFPGQGVGLDPQEETLSSILKAAGYATMHVGKWHCGDQPEFFPTRHGFDHYFGLPFSNDMGRQGGRDTFPPLPLLLDDAVVEQQPDQASLTSRYVEHSIRFMRENRDRPFFLYFAHMYVHLPHYPPRRFELESKNGPYGGAVACIDWATGVLMAELEALGIDRDTLVLFTSDNGSRCDYGKSNGHLRGTKNTCWEGGMRVPLIARWPDRIPAGHVSAGMLTGMDLMPTLAAIGGAAPSGRLPIDGIDCSDLLLGKAESSPRDTYFYYRVSGLYGVRKGRWKRVVASNAYVGGSGMETGLDELYDLDADPGETDNVAASHPEKTRELDELMEECRRDLGDDITGVSGTGRRPIGRVANPKPLTTFDPSHPYYMAMYDIGDAG
jgi:arylsulfatase A-like enzyme